MTISQEQYDSMPEWAKPKPVRLNPSQVKHKALKCYFCGAIFKESEKLEHLESEGRLIYCPVAREAVRGH